LSLTLPGKETTVLLSDALRTWIEKRGRTWTPKVTEYVRHLAKGWERVLGVVDVGAVTPRDIERIEAVRDDGIRSGSALNSERGYCKAFFGWAEKMGMCRHNPVTTWQFRRPEVKREYVCVTPDEEARLIAVAPAWLGRYIRFGILTGLREGTIRELTWEMLRDSPLRFEIPGRIMKMRSAHTFPVTPKLLECLGAVTGHGPIFPDLPRAPLLWKAFKQAVYKAGVNPNTSPHDLRRTFVGRLSAAGVPVQTIMRLGAWKSMSTLLSHYCTAVPHSTAMEALSAI